MKSFQDCERLGILPFTFAALNHRSFLDDLERVTALKYMPNDG